MPSTSKRQARTMAKARKDPEFRKKTGIDKKTATEFNDADKRRAGQVGKGKVFGAIRRKRKGTS